MRILRTILVLFLLAGKSSYAINYSVNLIWINENENGKNNLFLYPASDEKDLLENLLSNIYTWSDIIDSKSVVNFWYDSEFVTKSAIESTEKIIATHNKDYPNSAQINLCDLRNLNYVKDNPSVFSAKTPVYFRADLLRIIAAVEILEQEEDEYFFVYADLNVTPIEHKQLFDDETKRTLSTFGTVLTRGGTHGFENSFQITGNNKPNLIKSLKLTIIDLSIKRVENILSGGRWKGCKAGDTSGLEQSIYDSLPAMFKYFYHLEKFGVLCKNRNVIHQLKFYGINNTRQLCIDNLKIINPIIEYEYCFDSTGELEDWSLNTFKVPTKVINVPLSHFGGEPTTKHNITPSNYRKKLEENLENYKNSSEFDNSFLVLVIKNDYTEDMEYISKLLSPEHFLSSFTTNNNYFNIIDNKKQLGKSPLAIAIEDANLNAIKTFINIQVERRIIIQNIKLTLQELSSIKNKLTEAILTKAKENPTFSDVIAAIEESSH